MSLKKICALFMCVAALQLAGCAQDARPELMVAQADSVTIAQASKTLQRYTVTSVTGGSATNALWMPDVSSEVFQNALTQSLKNYNLIGTDGKALKIDATLEKLDQPFAGLDMTVTASVLYKISTPDNKQVAEHRVVTPYTANFSDAFVATERLRMANEGAIRANIERFIATLLGTVKTNK